MQFLNGYSTLLVLVEIVEKFDACTMPPWCSVNFHRRLDDDQVLFLSFKLLVLLENMLFQ